MSDDDEAMAVLADVVPLGPDHPNTVALGEAVKAHVATRPPPAPKPVSPWTPAEASGIAQPGDVLVLGYGGDRQLTDVDVAALRDRVLERLPGVADVIIVPFNLVAIYRGGAP